MARMAKQAQDQARALATRNEVAGCDSDSSRNSGSDSSGPFIPYGFGCKQTVAVTLVAVSCCCIGCILRFRFHFMRLQLHVLIVVSRSTPTQPALQQTVKANNQSTN